MISSSKENNHRQLFSVVPEDYEKLKGYFKLRKPVTCENVITDSYIWKNYYNTKYYINEYGLVWIYRIKNQVFSSVPLCTDENMVASFYEMKEYFNSVLGVKLKLYLVDEHTKIY